jgi:hypothetical protein
VTRNEESNGRILRALALLSRETDAYRQALTRDGARLQRLQRIELFARMEATLRAVRRELEREHARLYRTAK